MPAPGHRRGSHHTAPLPSHRPLGAGSRGALRPEGLSLLVVLSATPPSGAGPAEGRNVGARLRARAGRRKDGAMHHAEVSRAAAGAADGSGGMQGAGGRGRPAPGGSARALWAGLCPQAPGSARAPRPADWRWAAPGRGSPGRAAMATRRLTDAFLLLRNNAVQSRQLLAEQVSSYGSSSPLNSRSMAAAVSLLPSSYVPCCAEGCPRPRRARCSAPPTPLPPPLSPSPRVGRTEELRADPCGSLPERCSYRSKRRWPSREVVAHWFSLCFPGDKSRTYSVERNSSIRLRAGAVKCSAVGYPHSSMCALTPDTFPPDARKAVRPWARRPGGADAMPSIALWPLLWLFVSLELVTLWWETEKWKTICFETSILRIALPKMGAYQSSFLGEIWTALKTFDYSPGAAGQLSFPGS